MPVPSRFERTADGQAFGMHPYRDIFSTGAFPAHNGSMFLVITIVVKREDVEIAKTRGQFADPGNSYTNFVRNISLALVLHVIVQQ